MSPRPAGARSAVPEAAPDPRVERRPDANGRAHPAVTRLLGVVLLALLGLYVARVAGLVVSLQRAALAESGLSADVAALRNEVVALETEAARSETDAFVEQWAREERELSRAGDRTIVVVPEVEDDAPVPARREGLLDRLRRLMGRSTPTGSSPADSAPADETAR